MPKEFFQIYNYSQSFAPSVGASAQSDYGLYGKQVDALFNGLSNTPGGTGSLAVRFVSDAGLTYYSNALGASASVTAYIRNKFPITTQALLEHLKDQQRQLRKQAHSSILME